MKFSVKTNLLPNKEEIVLHNDMSFGSKHHREHWDFQISLNLFSSFNLNIDTNDLRCTVTEGFFPGRGPNLRLIRINDSIPCSMYVNPNKKIVQYGGAESLLKNHTISYDEGNQILAIGDIDKELPLYQFGIGQFVKVSDNGELIAVYVKFSN